LCCLGSARFRRHVRELRVQSRNRLLDGLSAIVPGKGRGLTSASSVKNFEIRSLPCPAQLPASLLFPPTTFAKLNSLELILNRPLRAASTLIANRMRSFSDKN
jgi:hypothetical protein